MNSFYVFLIVVGILLGILIHTMARDIRYLFMDRLYRKTTTIVVKMRPIGNEKFSVRTIKSVRGLNRFPVLTSQLTSFQQLVDNLVDKIICYKLVEYYTIRGQIQSHINGFCNNLEDLNTYFEQVDCARDNSDEETIYDTVVVRAVQETEQNNAAVLEILQGINDEISHYIEENDIKLFPHPQA